MSGSRHLLTMGTGSAGSGIYSLFFISSINTEEINNDISPDVVIASSTYPLDSYPANWMAKKL